MEGTARAKTHQVGVGNGLTKVANWAMRVTVLKLFRLAEQKGCQYRFMSKNMKVIMAAEDSCSCSAGANNNE